MAVGVQTVTSMVGVVDKLIEVGKEGPLAEKSNECLAQLSALIDTTSILSDPSLQGRLRVEQNFF